MDGYLRVSRRMGREGPGYISKAVQRDAIQRWADYRGIEIVEWHVDEDESGGTQERPGLREAMRRVEAGETDGIACWRLNRFARNVAHAIEDVERVQAAGGALAFVEEDIDPTGPFGSFVLTVLLAVATLERENLVQGWKTAKQTASDRGVKIGPTPFGYCRITKADIEADEQKPESGRKGLTDDDESLLQPDPVAAPIVTEAFRLAAQGSFDTALAFIKAKTADMPIGTKKRGPGRRWTPTTFRRFLQARSYLGEARYGDLVKLDAHEPLVTRSIWQAAQPQEVERRRPRATFPLTGFARCAACGQHLVGSRAGRIDPTSGERTRVYRCSAGLKTFRGERCMAPVTVTAKLLEDLVRNTVAEALRSHPGFSGSGDPQNTLAEAETILQEAERELDDVTSDIGLRRTLGPERFRRLAESAVEAVETAQAAYREAARLAEGHSVLPAAELLENAEGEDLGELLRGALEAVVVERGRTPVRRRVRVIPKGSPSEAWLATTKDAQRCSVESRKRGGR
jgi:DNA invertase Pin-like site-specific DNA recombinase